MSNLNKTVVLITGASRGLGASIARSCASQGAKLILHYGQSQQAMQELTAELGDSVLGTVSMDLSKPGAGTTLWQEALKVAPDLNALVNNAGSAAEVQFTDTDEKWQDVWSKVMAVNLQAPADLCRAAIASFKQHDGGQIVNIASRAGQRGDGLDLAAYAASKGALLAFTRTIAKGTARDNICAYNIAPGWINTDMAPTEQAVIDKAISEIPIGRFAEPSEIGDLTAFLLSGACSSATGATFDVNGASYLR